MGEVTLFLEEGSVFIEFEEKNNNPDQLSLEIISEYAESDVVSGEFIYSLYFDGPYNKEVIKEAIQIFLDWDESTERGWVVNEFDGYYDIGQ